MTAPNRIDLLRRSTSMVGIDFVRVAANQQQLTIFLHHKSPLPIGLLNSLKALKPDQIRITGLNGVLPAWVTVFNSIAVEVENNRRVIRIQLVQRGGFGMYRLFVDHPAFDAYFNNIEFTFKATCDSDLDCAKTPSRCAAGEQVDFPVDYRARDFWSFRQALMDFASQRYPDWQDRLEADIGMVIIEMLSALGDEFAYAQDRIAREVHFDTASQRRSLRHLSQLVDYRIDNGSGARAWLNITVSADAAGEHAIAAGTEVGDANAQFVFEIGQGLRDCGKEFAVSNRRNSFQPYLWDEDATCLPAGSTRLTLTGHFAEQFDAAGNIDPNGKWVLLATYPTTPDQPERRLMVRVPLKGATDTVDPLNGPTDITEICWEEPTPFDIDLTTLKVHGNMLPATSGKTLRSSFRVGPPSAADVAADAALPQAIERVGANGTLANGDALADEVPPRVKFLFSLPDSETTPLVWLPAADGADLSQPEISVTRRGDGAWNWIPELIGEKTAAPTAKVYTLEDGSYRPVFRVERKGIPFEFHDYSSNAGAMIRFGDGEFGLAPSDGSIFDVVYRLGNGRLMNVAADSITTFISQLNEIAVPTFVESLCNPMPAAGGRDPEADDAIRTNAPQAFRAVTHRAVRPEDFDEIVPRELEWVQCSGSTIRWTGSWPTVFVTPDPHQEIGLSSERRQKLERLVERVRQAGREVKVLAPGYAKIDLEIHIQVRPDAYAGEVEAAVLDTLFGKNDKPGFFSPDNFTFGTPLSRAALMATIQDTPGVCAVDKMRVRWRGHFGWRPFSEFMLLVGKNEVIQIDNNRLLRERGAVTLVMGGGA